MCMLRWEFTSCCECPELKPMASQLLDFPKLASSILKSFEFLVLMKRSLKVSGIHHLCPPGIHKWWISCLFQWKYPCHGFHGWQSIIMRFGLVVGHSNGGISKSFLVHVGMRKWDCPTLMLQLVYEPWLWNVIIIYVNDCKSWYLQYIHSALSLLLYCIHDLLVFRFFHWAKHKSSMNLCVAV